MKNILKEIGLNILLISFTYLLTICSLFMFDSLDPLLGRINDAIAITTITYCLSVIAHNIAEQKGPMMAIITLGLLLLYTFIYVASKSNSKFEVYFKIVTHSLIILSFISESYRTIKNHQATAKNRFIKLLSAQ